MTYERVNPTSSYTFGIRCSLQQLTTAAYDKYLERKLFCSSVIYDKVYISFLS